MQLLIDTQIFIWAVMDSARLGARARRVMFDAATVFVSAASIWEIAIKAKIGKIQGDPKELADAITKSGFSELPVSAGHAAKVSELPLHHRDPFDRILIAQSLSEPLRFLTADGMLARYSDLVISV